MNILKNLTKKVLGIAVIYVSRKMVSKVAGKVAEVLVKEKVK